MAGFLGLVVGLSSARFLSGYFVQFSEGIDATVIMREYSRFASPDDEPFYPVATSADNEKLSVYQDLAAGESQVFFGGRLGTYKYFDMDKVIAAALTMFESIRPQFAS